jgi:molecular chaperone GrpE
MENINEDIKKVKKVKNKSSKNKQSNLDLELELTILKDKYLRLYSEFDNYKKRTERDFNDFKLKSLSSLYTDLIPSIDSYELSKLYDDRDVNGLILIIDKFIDVLRKNGLEEIKINRGDDFNPDIHQALMNVDSEFPRGKIVDILERGYFLNKEILKYPKVSVSK